jgi:ankyrin repeat protein
VSVVVRTNATGLHFAVFGNRVEAIKAVAALGADVHAALTDGVTPVHIAAFLGYVDATKALAALGGDVSARMDDGQRRCTLLHRMVT